jgi:hypothetical protein
LFAREAEESKIDSVFGSAAVLTVKKEKRKKEKAKN